MDCSPPGSSVHGISQARILEWVAISSSRGSSATQGSNLCLLYCRQSLYQWVTWEAHLVCLCLNINTPKHCSWEGNGNPLQYSCLESPVDRGAWWAAVHGVAQSQTWLSYLACMHALAKVIATHSSVLAWRIPGTGEPGGLLSMGSHRVEHDWSDLAAANILVLLLFLREYDFSLIFE